MKIISYNVNGIRAAIKKGFVEWVAENDFDVICIQETKAQPEQVDVSALHDLGYHDYWHSAEKKGYSGVALYCKQKPDEVVVGMGLAELDCEGRYLEARFGKLSVVSLYMPSGSAKEERQLVKYRGMDFFMPNFAWEI